MQSDLYVFLTNATFKSANQITIILDAGAIMNFPQGMKAGVTNSAHFLTHMCHPSDSQQNWMQLKS